MKVGSENRVAVPAVFSPSTNHSRLPIMTKLHWLEVSEYASISLSALGLVATTLTQQMIYVAAPLTISVCLNVANRERLKYLKEQNPQEMLVKQDLLLNPLRQRLANFDTFSQNLSKTTGEQLEQLQNQQQQSLNIFTQRLEQFETSVLNLRTTFQQQVEELQRHRQSQNIDAFQQHVTQLDAFVRQFSENTQNQINPLNQRLSQIDGLTQQLNQNIQQQLQELRRWEQRLVQTEAEMQQLSANTLKQLEPVTQGLAQLDTFTQQSNQTTQQQNWEQRFTQIDAFTKQLSHNTQKQIEECLDTLNQLKTEIRILTELVTKTKPQFQNEETEAQSKNFETPLPQANIKLLPPLPTKTQNPQLSAPASYSQSLNPPTNQRTFLSTTDPNESTNIQEMLFQNVLQGHTDRVMSVIFSSNGEVLASGSHDKTIKIWDLDKKEARTLQWREEPARVNSVAFSPNGKILVSGNDDKTVKLWNVGTGEELFTLIGHKDTVYSVAFSPDGKTIASGSKDKTIKLWSTDNYKEIHTIYGHADEVLCVAFSSDGKILASGGANNDKTIKVWYLSEDKFLTLKGEPDTFGRMNSVAFSPNGKHIASGSSDKTIKIWQLPSGEELQTLLGHTDDVYSVTFSPDGKTLASGSRDKTVKLWQVDTGEEIRSFIANDDAVYSVAFNPDGKTLAASGGGDKTIKLLPSQ